MGVEHLKDKRTGRPRGSKTTPAWVREVRWVARHLGKPDAEPPSDGARFWLDYAREHPAQFFECLVTLDSSTPKADERVQRPENEAFNASANLGAGRKAFEACDRAGGAGQRGETAANSDRPATVRMAVAALKCSDPTKLKGIQARVADLRDSHGSNIDRGTFLRLSAVVIQEMEWLLAEINWLRGAGL